MHAARRSPPRAHPGIASPRPRAYPAADWRHALAAPYRPFQLVTLQGAIAGPLTNGTLLVPLLMSLGMSAGAVWLLMLVPSVGVVLQAMLPMLLRHTGGRLRAITVVAFAGSATRGPWFAALVLLRASGILPPDATIAGLVAVLIVAGVLDNVGANGLGVWYGLVLPEADRRRVLPRLTTLGAAVTTGVLWLMTVALGPGSGVPAAIDVLCFVIAGAVSLAGLVGLLRLPDQGRIHPDRLAGPPTGSGATAPSTSSTAFRNLCTSSTLAAVGGGFMPAVALIALGPLGLPASYTVLLAAVSATLSLVGSAAAATVIGGLSASRVMRATHLARMGEVAAIGIAVLVPPLAPALLLSSTAMDALTSAANGIAGSELLYRTAGAALTTQRGRYTALTHGSYTIASLAASTLVAASATAPIFLGLLALAGTLRLAGAATLRVGPGWRDPVPGGALTAAAATALDGQAADAVAAPSVMDTGRPLAALS